MSTTHSIWLAPLDEFIGRVEPSDDDRDEWIIRDMIPRGESWLLAGKWKGGKTWTAISLAIHVALGEDWLGDTSGCDAADTRGFKNCLGRPGRVLLVTLEDGRPRLARRVWRVMRGLGIGAGDARQALLYENLRISDVPIKLPGQTDELIADVAGWQPDLIMIDSLTRAMQGDQNSIKEASAFTDAWRKLVRETGAAVCPLHHTNKRAGEYGREGDPMSQIRGSGELLAAPRHIVVMTPIDEPSAHKSLVTMGGNLDVERDSFVLEYQATEGPDGKTAVRLHDRGSTSAKEGRAIKQAAKKQAVAAKQEGADSAVLGYALANPGKYISAKVADTVIGSSAGEATVSRLRAKGWLTPAVPGSRGSRITTAG